MSQHHAESVGPFSGEGGHQLGPQRSGREATTGPTVEFDLDAEGAAAPFIWQDGPRLHLLVREDECWTIAELRFMTPECRYIERRRARYAWAREAAGAMLARAARADPASRGRLACAVNQWIAAISPDSINTD